MESVPQPITTDPDDVYEGAGRSRGEHVAVTAARERCLTRRTTW